MVQEKVSQCKHESNDMGKMSLMLFLKGKKPARKVGMYMCGKKNKSRGSHDLNEGHHNILFGWQDDG